MNIFRIRKNLSLHIVNLVGLAVMMAAVLVSVNYIKREYSYDRYNTNADRIARLSLQFGSEQVDGRIWGNEIDGVINQLPDVERMVKMYRVYSASLAYLDNHIAVNDIYLASRDFMRVFDVSLLAGDKNSALGQENQIIISESLARKLFNTSDLDEVLMNEIKIDEGYRIKGSFAIAGIFKDIPETSHFHTDALTLLPEEMQQYVYTYLLLKDNADIDGLSNRITELIEEKGLYSFQPLEVRAILMPLTDIHLHSHNLREMSVNGNIKYIYLIAGANILLLIIVLFNLWLNRTLLFSYNRRYYQLLRLYGASSSTVLSKEALSALVWGVISIGLGLILVWSVGLSGFVSYQLSIMETVGICLAFLFLVIIVSLIPVISGTVYTQFISTNPDLVPVKFSYSNVKWMLVGQYCAVMIVVILALGITRQLNLTKDTQVGGDQSNVLLLTQQPKQVMGKFQLLREKLMQNSEIKGFTTSFQIPGDAIRDHAIVRVEGSEELQKIPVMISGERFLSFFDIKMSSGHDFSPAKLNYQQENEMFMERAMNNVKSDYVEEYILNKKALDLLGFSSEEDAIGKMLYIEHNSIDYIHQGTIVGITEDYNYTGVYEETIPLLMMQRNLFQFSAMIRLDQANFSNALSTFENVWKDVCSDYPANYILMSDSFNKLYNNEIRAQKLVLIFSLLSFLLADLGLIVFVAFIIRKRTKEITIRKINGARANDIILMLNMNFVRYISYAFIIAIPVSWFILHRWLEQFAYRISLSWWLFILAGVIVLIISMSSIMAQSVRAASVNPVNGLKSN